MNILCIITPHSVHDQKWIIHLATYSPHHFFVVGENQHREELTEEFINEYQIHGVKVLPSIGSFSFRHPLHTLSAIRTLRKYIQSLHIDLVHFFFATPHALWANFIGCKYMITTRGSDVLLVLPALKESKGVYPYLLWRLFKRAFENAAAITCTSQKQIQQLTENFRWRVSPLLVRTGVPVAKIESAIGKERLHPALQSKQFIFSPRNIMPVYNLEIQVQAISLLPEPFLKQYSLVLIKDKYYDAMYLNKIMEKLAQIPSLEVIVLDYMSQEDMWTYYKHASLTMMTPLSDGTPNTALETMAAGCPLIIPNLDYDNVLFDNCCFRYKGGGANELAQLIVQAITNYPQQFLNKAKENVSRYGNQTIEMDKITQLYHSLGK